MPARDPEPCRSSRRSAATNDIACSAVLCALLALLPSEAMVGFPPPDRNRLWRRRLRSGSDSGTTGPLPLEPTGAVRAEALSALLATVAASSRVADPARVPAQTDPVTGPDRGNQRSPPVAGLPLGPAPAGTTVSPRAEAPARVRASHSLQSARPGDEANSAPRRRKRLRSPRL